MRPDPRRTVARTALAVALALLLLEGGARAEEAAPEPVRIAAEVDLSPVGDAGARIELRVPGAGYDALKATVPDPRRFLQDLRPNRADYEVTRASAAYDDAKRSVVLEMTLVGAVRNEGGGAWSLQLDPGYEFLRSSPADAPRAVAWFRERGTWENGTAYEGDYAYRLPPGASEARWDGDARVLAWRLAVPEGQGAPRLSLDLKTRDRVMSTVYKAYGLAKDIPAQWLAKAVVRNTGPASARNVRLRWRLQGYGDWSPWDKVPEIAPGQTAVAVHYPVLDASIARVRSNTPANAQVEFRWEDAAGTRHEDEEARRVVVLGVGEFVFGNLQASESFGTWQEATNNAPLIAAWVTRNDAVVKELAGMASRMAGGTGALSDEASAIRVLRACYELMRANNVVYQHPPALDDRSVSFDVQRVQNVKFPRETVRDRSGTCIDLAILYAALVNAVGLEPHLALVPGHCFPVIPLPGGRRVGVETTGVGGGLRFGSADFDRMLAAGTKELADAQADGRLHLVDVRAWWTRGVSNPELDELPADILQRWGVKEGPPVGPEPGPAPGAGLDALVGVWGGAMTEARIDDELRLDAMWVGVDRDGPRWEAGVRMEFTLAREGKEEKILAVGAYQGGAAEGDEVRFPPAALERTVVATGAKSEFQGNPLVMRLAPDGRLSAAFLGEGGFSVTLVRKAREEPKAPAPLDALVGSFGGSMGKADVGSGVLLDRMRLDLARGPDGAWTAQATMEFTVPAGGGTPVVVEATYVGGRPDGDAVRFEKVPWRRTVPATGQKDEIEGNPLVVRPAEGGLRGVFEGSDGYSFTLQRADAAPPPPPADAGTAPLVGAWGGPMDAPLEGGRIRYLSIDVSSLGERFAATVHARLEVDGVGAVEVDAVYDGGPSSEASGRLDLVSRRKILTLASGEKREVETDFLRLSLEGGALTGAMGSDTVGWTRFTLQPRSR